MRRRYAIALFVLFVTGVCFAQQLPQRSQHMFNKFTLNPAAAGSEKFLEASLWHRSQWTGFENAPRSQFLSVHSSFYKKRSGVGGYIFNDAAGPVRNTAVNFTYAYHLPVTRKMTFSMGLGFNYSQYTVDGNMIDLYHNDDPLIDQTVMSISMVPEASAGGMLYNNDFYIGLSALNMVNYKTNVFDELNTEAVMPMSTQFALIGAYRLKLEEGVYFVPSIYLNQVINNPFQADLNLRIDYMDFIQAGVFYRTGDAVGLLFGITFLKDFQLSYTYDLQFSQLKGQSNGSHEIMIRYRYFYNETYKMLYK